MSSLTVELPNDLDAWLDSIARRTGKSKDWYAQQALFELMRDYQDADDAHTILAQNNPRIPLDDLLREIDIETKE